MNTRAGEFVDYSLTLEEMQAMFGAKGVDPAIGDGLAECRKLLTITRSGKLKQNFIEGMACVGGCVGGPASLTHNPRALAQLDRHKKEATGTIQGTVEDHSGANLKKLCTRPQFAAISR